MAFALLPLLVIVIGFIVGLIILALRKSVSGIKVMLLGISITIVGGIIAIDPNSSFGGFEYLIVVLGLVVSIIGLLKKD